MLSRLRAALLICAVAAIAAPAAAVVVPKPPAAQPQQGGGKAKPSKPAAPAAPVVAPPPAAPVSPLLVRRRAAPPPLAGADYETAGEGFSEGQGWTLAVVGGSTANCSGALMVRRKNGPGAYEGDATFACQGPEAVAFKRATTLLEMPDGVIVTFGVGTADRGGPAWPPVRLMRESADRLTGAVQGADGNIAFTLARNGG
ncbi:hypothetical protein [Phenylobacterium sp.]|uniref:hypothetical protein n=1 Tax=Phenylobacterium sp. TaxID=1871053 RepID=UPI0011FABA33|nr:hypothetical protein [Phenylobacterium sp.]TAL32622.1 MAG: hypothetical protein EPN98_13770 [Phenylobacterium sp.]